MYLFQGCYGKDCVEFHFDSRNASKSFWKRCIEHHAFFRCTEVHKACRVRGKTRIFSRGSSFRYSGRTQRQVIEYVRETSARRRSFQRYKIHLLVLVVTFSRPNSPSAPPFSDYNGICRRQYLSVPPPITDTFRKRTLNQCPSYLAISPKVIATKKCPMLFN